MMWPTWQSPGSHRSRQIRFSVFGGFSLQIRGDRRFRRDWRLRRDRRLTAAVGIQRQQHAVRSPIEEELHSTAGTWHRSRHQNVYHAVWGFAFFNFLFLQSLQFGVHLVSGHENTYTSGIWPFNNRGKSNKLRNKHFRLM